eukprot:767684-Hanusia_phi.AAC.7
MGSYAHPPLLMSAPAVAEANADGSAVHGMKLAEEELPPAGLWTAKSRPVSLLPEKRHERRVKVRGDRRGGRG